MLIVLPILAFAALFLTLLGAQCSRQEALVGVRAALLKAAAFLGAYMLAFSELLGLLGLLTGPWAALSWGVALLGVGWIGWKRGLIAAGVRCLRGRWRRPDWLDWSAGTILVVILAFLFLAAIISPPNNDDSLQYHMSRVVHWSQNASLGHYSTAYLPQNMHPIGAELAILNARLLWGNDRLANLIQWLSMVGVLAGVTGIAGLLGAGKRAQWLAAAFAISVPIGLLEATSTQNDYVTAFWYLSMLFFMILSMRRKLTSAELLCVGLTLGLGMLTKATFYFYALLPLAFFCIRHLVKYRGARSAAEVLLVGVTAVVLNLGSWSRNFVTFGSIFGHRGFVADHLSSAFGPGALLGGLIRSVTQNFATPSPELNTKMAEWIRATFTPLDPRMADFAIDWAWNNENLAGNPLHFVLIAASLVLLLAVKRLRSQGSIGAYALLLSASFVFLASGVRYDIFGVRFQLPFLAAWAPLFGIAAEALKKKWLQPTLIVLLLLAALPWVLFNRMRPLIAMRESSDRFTIPCLAGCTAGSILNEPPESILFAGKAILAEPYVQATDALRGSGCRSVGLYLDSHDLEYTLWWLLDAPQSGIHLETIYAAPELERYIDPAFRPCAILCTICRGKTRLHGLDLASDYTGMIQLYLGNDYDPNADR